MRKSIILSVPAILPVLLALSTICVSQAQSVPQSSNAANIEIGGEKLVVLTRTPVSKTRPEFASLTLMPGRGMEFLYITANFPGKGEVQVLTSPDLATAKKTLDADTPLGLQGPLLGGAFLIPYPNRIRGKLSADGKTISTSWQGHALTLPASPESRNPAYVDRAIHGLILTAKAQDIRITKIPGGEQVTAVIHAGNFGSRWFSKTDLDYTVTLTADALDVTIVAHNIGDESEPIAIGWHPYFNLPSGNRSQARVELPASTMAQVDNYQSVIPTGKLLPVQGTKYDLRAPGGTPLGSNYYDDNWSHLDWKNGAVTVRITDPAAHYGIDVEALSRQISTVQMYSPPDKSFAAVEDQYNFNDPFGKQWGSMDTGMVMLKAGQSTTWHVRLHVFVP